MKQFKLNLAGSAFRSSVVAVTLVSGLCAFGQANAQQSAVDSRLDVLHQPSLISPLASHGLINALARAGDRLVAVGQRGHILVSDDLGKSWIQSVVPVSSDLVAVSFPTAKVGYAAGFDGVILKTVNAGKTWFLLDDGLKEKDRENPYLDLWFDSEDDGYAVGAFGKFMHTQNGGKSWVSESEKTANPKGFHIYNIKRIAGELYLAGEQGLLLKQNTRSGMFESCQLPYKGSLFGVVGNQNGVWVYGLRGSLFRGNSACTQWLHIPTRIPGALTASNVDSKGVIAVAGMSGLVVSIPFEKQTGSVEQIAQAMRSIRVKQPVTAFLSVHGQYIVGGPRGLEVDAAPLIGIAASKTVQMSK